MTSFLRDIGSPILWASFVIFLLLNVSGETLFRNDTYLRVLNLSIGNSINGSYRPISDNGQYWPIFY